MKRTRNQPFSGPKPKTRTLQHGARDVQIQCEIDNENHEESEIEIPRAHSLIFDNEPTIIRTFPTKRSVVCSNRPSNMNLSNPVCNSQYNSNRQSQPYTPKPKSPGRFSGDDDSDFKAWWHQITTYIDFFPTMTEDDKLKLVKASITGSALEILIATPAATQSLETIYNSLKQVFIADINWGFKVFETQQLPLEDVQTFAKRLRIAVIKASSKTPNIDSKFIDEQCLLHFQRNTRPEIRARLQIQLPATIELAIRGAIAFECEIKEHHTEVNTLHINQSKPHLDVKEPFNNDLKTRFKQLNDKMDTMNTKHSELPQTLNAFAAHNRATAEETHKPRTSSNEFSRTNQTSYKQNQRYVANEFKCFHCKGTGHGFERCFKASDQDKERIRNDSQRNNLKGKGKPWDSNRH